MPASAEPVYNTCYVIRARDSVGNVLFAATDILMYYQLPIVKNDTPEAHARRLGDLTPLYTFPFTDRYGTRFTVYLLEIENIECHSHFQLPGGPLNFIPAAKAVELLGSFKIHHMFSVLTAGVMPVIQKHLSALGHPVNYRWFLWNTEVVPGKPIEFSEEQECFCFSNPTFKWWKLPCNHCFHHICIETWRKRCVEEENNDFTCPMCRRVLR